MGILTIIYHLIDFQQLPNYPGWFPRPIKLWEGVYAPLVLIVSILIVTLLCFPFVPWNECTLSSLPQSYYCRRVLNYYSQELANYATAICLVSILYLYQLEYLLRNHFPFKKFFKLIFIGLITIFTVVNVQFTIKYWNYIYGTLTAFIHPPTTTSQINTATVQAEPTIKAPEIDSFKAAVNQAIIAAELTKSAQSQLDWDKVANHWENA